MRPALLAAVHAAAELLPVSSSGHLRALGGGAGDVAAHLVPLGVTVVAWRRDVLAVLRRLDRRRVGFHVAAGAIPSVAGVLVGARRDALPLPAGLVAGAGVLAAAELASRWREPHTGVLVWRQRPGADGAGGRSRWDAGVADGVWLGLAQTAALWPGVSRLGTTLAVARLRGFAPAEAPLLAREAGVPVTLGALAWQIRRSARRSRRADETWQAGRSARGSRRADETWQAGGSARRRRAGEAGAAVAGAVVALPLARAVDRGAPLWPFAAERALLAVAVRRRHG